MRLGLLQWLTHFDGSGGKHEYCELLAMSSNSFVREANEYEITGARPRSLRDGVLRVADERLTIRLLDLLETIDTVSHSSLDGERAS